MSLEEAIHFMLAGLEYTSCQEIPVHDCDSIKTVASLGHRCSGNCASALSTSLSESDGEVEIIEHPVKCMERLTCRSPYEDVEQDCVVNNDQESENELNETTELKTVVQSEKLEGICSYCQEETSETFDVIQCNDCKSWCHYKCTRLPLYQLYIYDLSNRKYSCENCVEVPDSLIIQYSDLEKKRPAQIKKSISIGIRTEIQTRDIGSNTEIQTRDIGVYTATCERKEMGVNTDEIEGTKIHEGVCQCDKIESEYVQMVDRISEHQENTKQQSSKLGKTSVIHQQSHQNETGVKEINQKLEMAEKKVKELTNKIAKADKIQQELQGKLNSTFIQNEIKQAKLEGEIEVLQTKLKTERSITAALQSDLENLETRYKNRNDIITDYDKRMKSQVLEINGLNDEILSLKLHACRVNDALLVQDSVNTVITTTQKRPADAVSQSRCERNPVIDIETQHSTPITNNKDNTVHTGNDDNSPIIINENNVNDKQNPKGQEIGSRPGRRKQVLLIGTSNIRYLNARLIAGRNSYIKKVTKYTVEEAKSFIQNYNLDFSPDLVVYQLGCNDIGGERNGPNEFSDDMDDLVSATNLKFHGVKVMVSLGLPRGNQMANAQVIDQSNKLVRKFNGNKTVTVCDNSRLFFKGKPSKGILRDDKHLSKKGTTILAQNINDIHKLLSWKICQISI